MDEHDDVVEAAQSLLAFAANGPGPEIPNSKGI